MGNDRATYDCQSCGACCREGYDTVEVDEEDPATRLHPELLHRGPFGRLNLRRDGVCCACLRVEASKYTCAIYATRPLPCRELEIGSSACLTARARVGLPT
ncbi:MAG: YkgJ family cysteine cluster protein [Deltaproteobacteria bacterium]|nr:MAG: YkgJ family cysteine cluster protein [Deltaproteobacteria bacterium]